MNLSDTSLFAYQSHNEFADCELELLNWMRARPKGYAATRHVIAELMGKELSWVCGRANKLLKADLLESLDAVGGRHPVTLTARGWSYGTINAAQMTERVPRPLPVDICAAPINAAGQGRKIDEVSRHGGGASNPPSVQEDGRPALNTPSVKSVKPVDFPAPAAPNNTEAHRHACEVRFCAALPSDERRRIFLQGVSEKRGKAAYERLRVDTWAVLQKRLD